MIQLPVEPKIVSKSENKALIEISPLYPGYGTTIGNVIRRVLISSLEGAAITSAKIKGVDHEFSAIPGIREDVIEIIANLKKVRVKSFSDDPIMISISSKEIGAITANDFKSNANIEVVNSGQHIATITDKKTEFELEVRVEKGVGYIPVEQRQKEKLTVGEIAIDGIFTPICNVNYTVENIRVGQRTDYNKVMLDIETDGTITPEETIKKASEILLQHFQIINKISVPETVKKIVEKKVKKKKDA